MPLKLNLGCGGRVLKGEGWVNIDTRDLPGVDLRCDASKLPYGDGAVDLIQGLDILEHFPRLKVESVLREWHRVLKNGGELIVKCPNLDAIIEEYRAKRIPADELIRLIYGRQEDEDPANFHKTGFTPESLRSVLRRVGFEIIRHRERMDGDDWKNQIIRVRK